MFWKLLTLVIRLGGFVILALLALVALVFGAKDASRGLLGIGADLVTRARARAREQAPVVVEKFHATVADAKASAPETAAKITASARNLLRLAPEAEKEKVSA